MLSKFKTLLWFLKRPGLYREMIRVLIKKMSTEPEHPGREQASKWCEQCAYETTDALTMFTDSIDCFDIRLRFHDDFLKAEKKASPAPKMGGPTDLNLLFWLAETIQATRVIETGVAYGWSSFAILLSTLCLSVCLLPAAVCILLRPPGPTRRRR